MDRKCAFTDYSRGLDLHQRLEIQVLEFKPFSADIVLVDANSISFWSAR